MTCTISRALRLFIVAIAIAAAALIVLPAAAQQAYAAEIIDSEEYENTMTWQLDSDGVLTFEGSGKIASYEMGAVTPWLKHRTEIKELVIKDGKDSLDKIWEIGTFAFYGLPELTKITLSSSMTTIKDSAFYKCGKLENVIIPNSVTSIESAAFSETALTDITIPSSIKNISSYTFYNCKKLENVTIERGIGAIGNSAFRGCESLKSVNIPVGITEIGEYAFANCKNLAQITIPRSVGTIGTNAFGDISSNYIANVAPDSFAESYFDAAHIKYAGYLGDNISYTLEDRNVVITGEGAMWDFQEYGEMRTPFLESLKIKTATVGEGITSLSSVLFGGCLMLKSVELPDSLESIGRGALSECTDLKEITLPANVKIIGASAFAGCNSLQSITFKGDFPIINFGAFYLCSATAYYPSGNSTWTKEAIDSGYGGRITWKVASEPKADNTLSVTGKTGTVSAKKVAKKAQTLKRAKVLTVNKGKANSTVTYTLKSVKKAKFKKYFKIAKKTGKVTVKKGLKKGTYKVTVKVTAAATAKYNAKTVTKTFTVKVK